MRLSLMALATTATFVAAPVLAQSTAVIDISGEIPARCSVITLASSSVTVAEFENSEPGAVGELSDAIAGAEGIKLTSTSAVVTCNGSSTKIEVDAEPMILPGTWGAALTNGFTNTVNFTATVSAPGYAEVAGGPGVIATNASADDKVTEVTVGLLASKLDIAVGSATTSGTLIAGTYSGSIGITLTPSV